MSLSLELNNKDENWNSRADIISPDFAFFQWKSEEEDKYQLKWGLLRDNCPPRDVKLANEIARKLMGGL